MNSQLDNLSEEYEQAVSSYKTEIEVKQSAIDEASENLNQLKSTLYMKDEEACELKAQINPFENQLKE